jgi:hypothetical protein
MIKSQQTVSVGGIKYPVREHSEILKADLNGYYGWTTVWASTQDELERRIKRVRSGGQ